jgi:tyrosyl-tRNA synthetase
MSAFLSDMKWRGLLQQVTDEPGLDQHLASVPDDPAAAAERRAYVGFDPTADSLTIGNLVGIMALARFQRAGHTPFALMGGATGLIGDPSGKSAERTLNTREVVEANVQRIQRIFSGGELLDFSPARANKARIVNNIDWLGNMGFLEALREIGKHFSVNMMIQKDSVKERLTNRDQGISYTEFSYMLLQGYDFAHLCEKEGVTLQMGGTDQFGNIVVGADLSRRRAITQSPAFGLTWPLVTKADGTKFGKTESGAIWLTADRTSPYAYYQFWLNAADADVVRLLKTYTFLSQGEIAALEHSTQTNPGARDAQRALAREATQILHGKTEMLAAEAAAKAVFSGDLASLPLATLQEALASAPGSTRSKAKLEGPGEGLLDLMLLPEVALASSKREAREFLQAGAVTINGRKAALDDCLTTSDLLHNTLIVLKRGKKNTHVLRYVG